MMHIPHEVYPPGFAEYLQPLLDARLRFLENMSAIEKRVCYDIVASFPQLGRGPTAAELAERTTLSLDHVVTTLTHLSTRDMLKYDAQTGCVVALYPFSDVPCPHQVQLAGQQRLYAMWPGGAIAIPIVYGPGTTATVFSECAQCQASIQFDMTVTEDGAVSSSTSTETLREWDPRFIDADRTLPHLLDGFWLRVQFFCSEEHFTVWKAVRPSEAGFLITFSQSARICQSFYGGLLETCRNL